MNSNSKQQYESCHSNYARAKCLNDAELRGKRFAFNPNFNELANVHY